MLTVFPFSFQLLCQDLALRLPSTRGIDTTTRVLGTIWLLSNQESYRGVADRFGMNKGTLHAITTMVIKALVSLKGELIIWPAHNRLAGIEDGFRRRCDFTGVVGAIDGTHIHIPGPGEHRNSYINMKGFASVQLHVVCDAAAGCLYWLAWLYP